MGSRALAPRFSGRLMPPRVAIVYGSRARARVGDPQLGDLTPSDADLAAAGVDVNSLATPQDRADAVTALNATRQAMAAAGNGNKVDQANKLVGAMILAGSLAFPPVAVLGGVWLGLVSAIKWFGDHVTGWAGAGLGRLGELARWFHDYPPQGTSAADGDGNWFDPVSGYRPGADTPYTHPGLNYVGPAEPLGPMAPRFDAAAAYNTQHAAAARAFALFAVPLIYRGYELAMNGRYPLDAQGFALLGSDAAAQVAARTIELWNSQHEGPGVLFLNALPFMPLAIPFAPASFTFNVGPMTGPKPIGSIGQALAGMAQLGGAAGIAALHLIGHPTAGGFLSQATPAEIAEVQNAQRAIVALASWLRYYGAK